MARETGDFSSLDPRLMFIKIFINSCAGVEALVGRSGGTTFSDLADIVHHDPHSVTIPNILRSSLPDRFALPENEVQDVQILISADGKPTFALKKTWRQNILKDRPSSGKNTLGSVREWLTKQAGANLLGPSSFKSETSSLMVNLLRDIEKREVSCKLVSEFGRHVPSAEDADQFIQSNNLKPSAWTNQKIIKLHAEVCKNGVVRVNGAAALTNQKATEKAKHDKFR